MTLSFNLAGQLKVGDKVNVERAMAAHTRFGGHMVQVSVPPPSIIRSSPIKPPHRLCTNHLVLSYSPFFFSIKSIDNPYS